MEAMTLFRSSSATSFFDEHVAAPTAADAAEDADSEAEGDVEVRYKGVVVEKSDEFSVGVENGGPPSVEVDDEDVEVADEGVGCELERLGSNISIWRWG